jgi:hypothetical protein
MLASELLSAEKFEEALRCYTAMIVSGKATWDSVKMNISL